MLKLILSTDGKHSVWVETEEVGTEEHLRAVYEDAKKLYGWILEDYGTKAEMWEEVMGGIKEDSPHCPLCDALMKKRKGSRGFFWGCSKYPECRGTKEI